MPACHSDRQQLLLRRGEREGGRGSGGESEGEEVQEKNQSLGVRSSRSCSKDEKKKKKEE